MEIWKDVEGYEGLYQVSDMGNVRSFDRTIRVKRGNDEYDLPIQGRILRPQARMHGYLSVWLYKLDGRRKQESVHRLVATAFCERSDEDTEVNHKNEIKTDNRAENLEWCTRIENTNHGSAIQRRSETRKKLRIGWKAVRQYDLQGNFIKEYQSLAEAEKQTGISAGNICNYIHNKNHYSHVGGFKWKYAER